MGPGPIWIGAENLDPHRNFFLSLSFLTHCVPLRPLSSCYVSLYNTQHKHHASVGIRTRSLSKRSTARFFCILVYAVLHPYLFLCVDCPVFCLSSLFTTQTSMPPPPGGIRHPNPSKQSAANPRLRTFGHWDQQDSIPGPSSP